VTSSSERFWNLKRSKLVALLIGWCLSAGAQTPIEVHAAADYQHIDYTYLFSDSTKTLTAADVLKVPIEKWQKGILSTYSQANEWVLIPLINTSDESITRVFYNSNAISHKLDIHLVLNGELQSTVIESGLARSSKNKLYNDPAYPHLITIPAHSELLILVKVYDPLSSIQVPMHLISLERANAFKDQNLTLLFFWLGILSLSIVLSLLLYVSTKESMFGLYVLFAIATGVIISSTTGMVTMFFDKDPYQIVTNYYQWGAVLVIVVLPRFINSLVPIFSLSPATWRVLRVLGYVGIGIALLYSTPFFKFSFFFTRLFINCVVGLTALTFLYVLVMLLWASIKRRRRAFALFIIYLAYLSLGFVNIILPLFGVREESLHAVHVVLIGSVVEIVAFMILMGQAALTVYKERQQLLEQVRENQEMVMQAIVKGQEDERNRFARDLHDGFGQMISALNLNLRGLQSVRGTDIENRMDIYNASSDILKNMHTELKNICFDLMPQTLLKHGLEAALMEFAQRINASAEKHVDVHVHGLNSRLSELQEISLYRITQEWVNNILKYSDARRITIQITRDETELTLIIEDDGMGFDQKVLKQGKGNGWRNIQARANLISGQIDVDTQPTMRGTSFILNANILTTPINRRAFLEAQTRVEA